MYDRLALRRFEFVPLWGLRVFFLYPMRRVDCPRCGVTVERVPWADGKHQLTTTYMWFLARWAKCLSWQEVARVFRTSWDQVFRSVAMAVAWGRDHVDLTGIRAIGIDEIHWQRGSQFLTLVYQIDPTRKRLLWIGQHRRAKTLLRFFRWFGRERTAALAFICSDMWKAYLKVVAKKAGHALHILDRFHIAKHMSDAIDQVRRAEVRSLRQRGTTAAPHEGALGPPETQGESDTRAARPLARAPPTQPAGGPRHAAAGMVRPLLALPVGRLGRGLPGRVVRPSHALAHRADEEGRPYVASPSTADLELVSRARRDFRGHRGGLQQQSETDHQKGVRLSLVSMPGNRSVPYTRSATGVRNYPQILLKTRK